MFQPIKVGAVVIRCVISAVVDYLVGYTTGAARTTAGTVTRMPVAMMIHLVNLVVLRRWHKLLGSTFADGFGFIRR